MYESGSVTNIIGVAFGTYSSSEGLVATIEDLLSSQFFLNDLCVVGPVRSLSHTLNLLQEQSHEDVDPASLFAQTESFFGDDSDTSVVGSEGRFLSILKGLMERRRNCTDESKEYEYNIDCPELKKQIGEGHLTLFVCTSVPDLLVPALRILIKRSSFNVQSHEFRR